jgi:hypothetical protein
MSWISCESSCVCVSMNEIRWIRLGVEMWRIASCSRFMRLCMFLISVVLRMAPHLIHICMLCDLLTRDTRPSVSLCFFRLLSQYFDTLAVVGANSLILEHDPQTVANLQSQVRHSFGNGSFGNKDR